MLQEMLSNEDEKSTLQDLFLLSAPHSTLTSRQSHQEQDDLGISRESKT